MKTYILLIRFTPKGVAALKESPQRAEAFRVHCQSHQCAVRGLYWTFGSVDGVLVLEAEEEAAAQAAVLRLAHGGFVTTETLRALEAAEMQAVLAKLG